MHFLLRTKGSHQSPSFDTFKGSGEILPNFSCHFPNHNLAFLQILHHSLVSRKITTPRYFFRSKVMYFAQKENQPNCTFLGLSSARVKIHQIFVNFETKISFSSNCASLFSVMRHNSCVLF